MRKGKGRPDITEVMFYSGYPSGSNSSLGNCNSSIRFLLAKGGGPEGGDGGGGLGYGIHMISIQQIWIVCLRIYRIEGSSRFRFNQLEMTRGRLLETYNNSLRMG